MPKIKITKSERFPDFDFTELPTNDARYRMENSIEVPEEKLKEWKEAERAYNKAQSEMLDYYNQS